MIFFTLTQSSVSAPAIKVFKSESEMDTELGGDWQGPFITPEIKELKKDIKFLEENGKGSNDQFILKEYKLLLKDLENF